MIAYGFLITTLTDCDAFVMLSDVGTANVALTSENSTLEKHTDTEKHKQGAVKS